MIYFDMVANLMHDIWKGLAPSPIRALFTKSNEIHGYSTTKSMPLKEILFKKKLSWKFSNTLSRELELCYGVKFLQTGEMYLNHNLPISI